MNTPREYDPHSCRAFPVTGISPKRFDALDAAARAVIAAGRPHESLRIDDPQTCECGKCVAYDALADLLKVTP